MSIGFKGFEITEGREPLVEARGGFDGVEPHLREHFSAIFSQDPRGGQAFLRDVKEALAGDDGLFRQFFVGGDDYGKGHDINFETVRTGEGEVFRYWSPSGHPHDPGVEEDIYFYEFPEVFRARATGTISSDVIRKALIEAWATSKAKVRDKQDIETAAKLFVADSKAMSAMGDMLRGVLDEEAQRREIWNQELNIQGSSEWGDVYGFISSKMTPTRSKQSPRTRRQQAKMARRGEYDPGPKPDPVLTLEKIGKPTSKVKASSKGLEFDSMVEVTVELIDTK